MYTPITNVTKEKGLDIGSVLFKDKALLRYMTVEADKLLSKTLMKTRREEFPNIQE